MEKKTTGTLTSVLKQAKPADLQDYLSGEASSLIVEDRPFALYMRDLIRRNGLTQQEVFLSADMSESYGYKLIAEEKRTKQRDTILKLCFAAHLTLDEAQHALTLYGMAPLYPKFPRDAILMVAFNSRMYELSDVDALLTEHHAETLYAGTSLE